jgi:hypothetical protein
MSAFQGSNNIEQRHHDLFCLSHIKGLEQAPPLLTPTRLQCVGSAQASWGLRLPEVPLRLLLPGLLAR